MISRLISKALYVQVLPFEIQPISNPMFGPEIEFAYSKVTFANSNYETFRRMSRGERNSWDKTEVVLVLNGVEIIQFERGEDPRFAVLGTDLFLYFQEYLPNEEDCVIHLYNVRERIKESFFPPSAFGFNGKNWSFYRQTETNYVLYSAEPLQIAKLDTESRQLHPVFAERKIINQWGDDFEISIGNHRSGTQPLFFIEIDAWVTFTHITLAGSKKPYHQLGVCFFDKDFSKVVRVELTRFKKGLLIDPYGAVVKGNEVKVFVSAVCGELHDPSSIVQNVSISFDTQILYSLYRNAKT